MTKAKKVKLTQLRQKILSLPKGPLVVGVSGGLDSCVLLHLLHKLVNQRNNPLQVCYVEHGIRAHPIEAEALPSYCQNLHLALRTYRIKRGWLCREATRRGLSLEDLARIERYRRLEHCLRSYINKNLVHSEKKQLNWGAIVLAHHADDQAESFFMNLGRGAGLIGLAGMREWQQKGKISIWRPLLNWSRQDLQQWAETYNIPHWEDSSNFQQVALRSFYRWQVLPQLKRLVPGLLHGIRRSQQHLVLWEDWLLHEREILKSQLQFSSDWEGGQQIEWYGDFSNLVQPLQVELIFLLFDYLRHGEQRRKRLPLGFVLELLERYSRQCYKPVQAHRCLWQLSREGLFVCSLPENKEDKIS